MRIVSLHVEGWMCFGDRIELSLPAGPIAIVARYAGDADRSNWAGKTALLEAVRWALYGTHRKRTDDAVITHGAPRAQVWLLLDGGTVVERTRPRGGPTVLRVSMAPDGENRFDGTGDAAQAALDRVLRLSAPDFESTTWFGQGDTEALVGQSSGPRRQVVARWLDLEVWDRAGKGARTGLERARQELDVARAAAGSVPLVERSVEELQANVAGLEDEIAVVRERCSWLESVLARAAEVERARAGVATAKQELKAAGARAQDARKAASDAAALVVDTEEGARLASSLKAAAEALGAMRAERDVAHRLVTRGFDGRCPIIDSECPARSQVEVQRQRFAEKAKEAGEKFKAQEAKHSAAHDAHERAQLAERAAVGARKRLDEAIAATHAIAERVKKLEAVLEAPDVPTPEVVAEWRNEFQQRSQHVSDLARDLGEARAIARHAAQNVDAATKAAERVATAEKMARAALLAARALGPTGIPARIAADQLTALERSANALLSGSGLSFTLSWQRELGDPATECRECGREYEKRTRAKECPACGAPRGRRTADELDILVDDGSGGELEDARVKSGGAKVLVAAAVRLAGGMLLRERRGSPLAIAVVDEPFGPLDRRNRTTLARTFAGMLGSVGIEQAFVVSHDEALLSALPSKIVVVRDGKRSRAEVE